MNSGNVATIFSSLIFGMPEIENSKQFLKFNEIRCIILEFLIQFGETMRVCF